VSNPRSAIVELDGVARRFPGPPEVVAVRNARVRLQAGEYVALTGPSGSGKSTLVNIVALLDRPTSGRYLLNGADTMGMPERQRALVRGRQIGVVFQSFHLMAWRTALENVAVAGMYAGTRRQLRMRMAAAMLDRVGLGQRAGSLTATMSGGERQRVAIARALATQPSLLLCDEPTGNLDSAATEVVLDLLAQLNREGVTILVITHDRQVAARAGRQLAIVDGVVDGLVDGAVDGAVDGLVDGAVAPAAGDAG